MLPGQQVKVHKSASFVDILEVCKFTKICDRKGYCVLYMECRGFPNKVVCSTLARIARSWTLLRAFGPHELLSLHILSGVTSATDH